jgi:hypothetical protein
MGGGALSLNTWAGSPIGDFVTGWSITAASAFICVHQRFPFLWIDRSGLGVELGLRFA